VVVTVTVVERVVGMTTCEIEAIVDVVVVVVVVRHVDTVSTVIGVVIVGE